MSAEPPALALRCQGVSKRFGGVTVADGLNLEVQPGEFCALLGPSGCGKTTSLRLIAGFETLDAGSIAIGNRVVASAGDGPAWAMPPEQRRVGMVFQDYALFPHLSVRENVAFGLDRRNQVAVGEALDLVGLEAMADRLPAQLSGGQQQRVALARALAPRPDILLLDEPFSNLDAGLRSQVRAEVRDIVREAGATAVLVTHDQEEALCLADRVAIMLGGRVAQVGPPEEVYLRPSTREVADFLGEAQYLPGVAEGRQVRCLLGDAPLYAPHHGPATVMVRPESLSLCADDGAQGTVRARQYLGHSYLLTVRLDAGPEVTVRAGPHGAPLVGDRVCVRLLGPVHVLPA
ncbi:MAG: ABC transporter ATP-binding protein [Thermomicrobiales bacterium]|nr:ABC transporter ATP-binding protein [Thermomicrobiales bacterium]